MTPAEAGCQVNDVAQDVDVQARISQVRQRLESARPGVLGDAQDMLDDLRPGVLDRVGGRARDLQLLQGRGPLDRARDALEDRTSSSPSSGSGSTGGSSSSTSSQGSSRGGFRDIT